MIFALEMEEFYLLISLKDKKDVAKLFSESMFLAFSSIECARWKIERKTPNSYDFSKHKRNKMMFTDNDQIDCTIITKNVLLCVGIVQKISWDQRISMQMICQIPKIMFTFRMKTWDLCENKKKRNQFNSTAMKRKRKKKTSEIFVFSKKRNLEESSCTKDSPQALNTLQWMNTLDKQIIFYVLPLTIEFCPRNIFFFSLSPSNTLFFSIRIV